MDLDKFMRSQEYADLLSQVRVAVLAKSRRAAGIVDGRGCADRRFVDYESTYIPGSQGNRGQARFLNNTHTYYRGPVESVEVVSDVDNVTSVGGGLPVGSGGDKAVGPMFSDKFLKSLSDARTDLSLSATMDKILSVANSVGSAKGTCGTAVSESKSLDRDVDAYGVDVVVDIRRAQGLKSAYGIKPEREFMSARDVAVCYTAMAKDPEVEGARVEVVPGGVGRGLVDDPGSRAIGTAETVLSDWKKMVSDVTIPKCPCVREHEVLSGRGMLLQLLSRDETSDIGKYECLPGGGFQFHVRGLCNRFGEVLGGSYWVSKHGMLNSVDAGFCKWLHSSIGCRSDCKGGAVYPSEHGWSLAQCFDVDGGAIVATTTKASVCLNLIGLSQVQHGCGFAYSYKQDRVVAWLADGDAVSKVCTCGTAEHIHRSGCVVRAVLMLQHWFAFESGGELRFSDVLRAGGYRLDAGC